MNKFLRWMPSRKWLILPPILVGVGVLVVIIISGPELPKTEPGEAAIPVRVIRVDYAAMQSNASGYGTARPSRIWTAVAEVPGRILYTHPSLDSGKYVPAETLLLRIDEADYQSRYHQRKADLDGARAKLKELEASRKADKTSVAIEEKLLQINMEDLQRLNKLRDNRVTSASEVDRARGNLLRQEQTIQKLKNALDLYPSKIDSANANIQLAESRLAEAKRDIDRTRISNPIAGMLAMVDLETHQVVGQGERLFEIHDSRFIEIEAQFSLAQLDRLLPVARSSNGEPAAPFDTRLLDKLSAEVIVRSGRLTLRWSGRPIRVGNSADPQTRTLGVVVEVDNHPGLPDPRRAPQNPDPTAPVAERFTNQSDRKNKPSPPGSRPVAIPLRGGLFCEVKLLGPVIRKTLSVPRSAVSGSQIYVVDQDSRLRKRDISTGLEIDDRIAIVSGLAAGERVVVKPPVPAIEGMKVAPMMIDSEAKEADRGANEKAR